MEIRYSTVLAVLACGWLAGLGFAGEKEAVQAEPKLAVAIRVEGSGLKVGDPVPIRFAIANRGKAPYRYMDRDYDRGGRMEEYRLEAVDAGGAPVPDPRARRKGGM